MSNLLANAGGHPQKDPKFVPLFIERAFTGLNTQRAALHDPSDLVTSRYYGGRPDSLWMGSNVELSNNLTLRRRPGLSPFSSVTYPTVPDRAFSFELTNNTIQVVIDTGSSGNLNVSQVVMSSGDSAVYIGTFPNGADNAYEGLIFQVSGFTTIDNNGTFVCLGSTTTTLTLENSRATPETDPAFAVTAGGVYVDNQNGTKTLLFAKTPGAGQSYFVAVGGVLYVGDGTDTNKYTPLNSNGTIWKWGIAAPTVQPSVTIVPSASAAVTWQANTVWSTMGLIYDTTSGTMFQLNSVNASTVNTTQFGTSGPGVPLGGWNTGFNGLTNDNGVVWQNDGIVTSWSPNTRFASIFRSSGGLPEVIYDPVSKAMYVNAAPDNGPGAGGYYTGPQVPNFKPGNNQTTIDNQCIWQYVGIPGILSTWQSGHVYPKFVGSSQNPPIANYQPATVTEPVSLNRGLPTDQPVYWQVVKTAGTSGATNTAPFGNSLVAPGTIIGDNGDLLWLSLGSGTWAALTDYSAWTASGSLFSAIVDTNGNFQVCTTTGKSGSTIPTNWGTTYGSQTQDATVVWTCVGPQMHWAANTIWFLPTPGFSPPSNSSPYGGASVVDSNGDEEFVIVSGKGGAVQPIWNAIGQTTVDGAATWYNLVAATTESLSWQQGLVYAYSFKARSLTDFYSVDVPGTNTPPIPPGLSNPLPPPSGSETGAISTASPVFTIVGSDNGAVNTISGFGSTDPQVDTIVIWRSTDGGGYTNMFELTEIPSPPPINGIAQPWTFKDFLPQAPTALFPGLNPLIPAPINDSNDPPNAAFLPMVYNFQRIWGALGQMVAFSGGPDVVTGNPNEAFLPSDEIPFLAQVVNIVKNTQGLVTFLTDSIQLIAGGPQTASFFSVELCPNVGLLSFNELDVHAGEIYFFSADNQFYALSPSLNLSRCGFPIGDQLANLPSSGVSDTSWNPAQGYVTVHQNGTDNCIFLADGSTGWYRLNPYQVPGVSQGPEPIWSPYANITNGCQLVQSVQTAPGIKKLLVGVPVNQPNETITAGVINFGTANTYGIVANTTVANTGSTTITGNLGLNPGTVVTGAPTVTGVSNINNTAAVKAQADVSTAYNQAVVLASTILQASDLGTQTLTAGIYSSQSGVFTITSGNLTLDAQNNPNAIWVFQVAGNLTVANSRSITLVNGASANNVFWQVGGSVTIGTGLTFNGTIAALTSITVGSGTTVNGGLWAQTGSVTLNTDTISSPASFGNSGKLVLPGATTGYQILYRNLSIYTDNGTQYDAWYTMGSIVLVSPGQLAVLKFLEMDFSGKQFQPNVSFLLNEIAGTFTPFTASPQFDPPDIYGTTGVPGSYSPNRYYFSTTKSLARCRHMMIKIDYGKTPNPDEIFNATIFGRLLSEF